MYTLLLKRRINSLKGSLLFINNIPLQNTAEKWARFSGGLRLSSPRYYLSKGLSFLSSLNMKYFNKFSCCSLFYSTLIDRIKRSPSLFPDFEPWRVHNLSRDAEIDLLFSSFMRDIRSSAVPSRIRGHRSHRAQTTRW